MSNTTSILIKNFALTKNILLIYNLIEILKMKRSSTRNIVISKAMRYVDDNTRKEYHDRRIQALECNNYIENEQNISIPIDDDIDDDYNNDSDDNKINKKKNRKLLNKKNISIKSKWETKVIRPLERLLLDNGIVPNDTINKKG